MSGISAKKQMFEANRFNGTASTFANSTEEAAAKEEQSRQQVRSLFQMCAVKSGRISPEKKGNTYPSITSSAMKNVNNDNPQSASKKTLTTATARTAVLTSNNGIGRYFPSNASNLKQINTPSSESSSSASASVKESLSTNRGRRGQLLSGSKTENSVAEKSFGINYSLSNMKRSPQNLGTRSTNRPSLTNNRHSLLLPKQDVPTPSASSTKPVDRNTENSATKQNDIISPEVNKQPTRQRGSFKPNYFFKPEERKDSPLKSQIKKKSNMRPLASKSENDKSKPITTANIHSADHPILQSFAKKYEQKLKNILLEPDATNVLETCEDFNEDCPGLEGMIFINKDLLKRAKTKFHIAKGKYSGEDAEKNLEDCGVDLMKIHLDEIIMQKKEIETVFDKCVEKLEKYEKLKIKADSMKKSSNSKTSSVPTSMKDMILARSLESFKNDAILTTISDNLKKAVSFNLNVRDYMQVDSNKMKNAERVLLKNNRGNAKPAKPEISRKAASNVSDLADDFKKLNVADTKPVRNENTNSNATANANNATVTNRKEMTSHVQTLYKFVIQGLETGEDAGALAAFIKSEMQQLSGTALQS